MKFYKSSQSKKKEKYQTWNFKRKLQKQKKLNTIFKLLDAFFCFTFGKFPAESVSKKNNFLKQFEFFLLEGNFSDTENYH